MNAFRKVHLNTALNELADLNIPDVSGRNGEELATDEAAAWKRALNLRVARWLKPRAILETHPGLGISTHIYRHACPQSEIHHQIVSGTKYDLIDVDPFGQPWDILEIIAGSVSEEQTFVMVTSGEIQCVVRRLHRSLRYPTSIFGRQTPTWVTSEYIPLLESKLALKCRFFYAFPTSIRCILCNRSLPHTLWEGCPQWMWWLDPDVCEIGGSSA